MTNIVGFVASWDVGIDGSLSQKTTYLSDVGGAVSLRFKSREATQSVITLYLQTFSLTQVPGRRAVLATDPAPSIGAKTINIEGLYSSSTGASVLNTTTPIPISGQVANCWSTLSKKTGSFFLIDTVLGLVNELQVDPDLNGMVVSQHIRDLETLVNITNCTIGQSLPTSYSFAPH